MIITVTMNPAMDKTAEIDKLVEGGLNRLNHVVLDAGGKGINVSKMISSLGGTSIATGFLGGSTGSEIEFMIKVLEITTDFVNINHTTRTNLKLLIKSTGDTTEFNDSGAVVTGQEMDELKNRLISYAKPGVIFVLAGSLPQGVAPDTYNMLIQAVKEKGASVFLDADGQAFREALPAKPDFIKPNKFELMQYFEKENELSLEECVTLCKQLVSEGIGKVILSMGAEGALFVSADEVLHAPGLPVEALSTVGAGDSMVGALVYAFDNDKSLKEAATLAMAASAGAVTTEGTKPPSKKLIDELLEKVTFEAI